MYEVSKAVKSTETESRMVIAREWGRGWNKKLGFNGSRISVRKVGKVPDMDAGDGSTTLWIYLMPSELHV